MLTRSVRNTRTISESGEKKVRAYEDFWNSISGDSSVTKFLSDKQVVYIVCWLNEQQIRSEIRI